MIRCCFKSRYIHQINGTLSTLDATQLVYRTVNEQFKTNLFNSNGPNNRTIAILLLYCFLGEYNKELVGFFGSFLSLKAKVDRSQSSVFRIFSHCQRNRKVKSTGRFNERFPASSGVFSLVFGGREYRQPAGYQGIEAFASRETKGVVCE